MEEFPTGFLYILLGVIVGAVILVLMTYVWKQYKLNRLQNPHKDYSYHRHE